MNITTEQIKTLRDQTGAGMLNCKTALVENDGNLEKAVEFLRQKGLASAEKKLGRSTKQGIITSYIHTGAKIGILLTVKYVSLNDIPNEIWDSEKRIEGEKEDIKNKPDNIKENIIKGRIEKTLKTYTLLDQACIRDQNLSVEEYVKQHVSLLGENIQISRFSKFILGENIVEEEENN